MQMRSMACVLAGLTCAAQAQLGSVSMSFMGVGAGRAARVQIDSRAMNVFAGQLQHYVLDGEGAGIGLIGNQTAYCVDLFEHVSSSPNDFTLVSLDQASDSEAMGAARASAAIDALTFAGDDAWGPATDDLGSAVQLALWEIIYDYDAGEGSASLDFTDGRFRATQTNGSALWASVQSIADSLFGSIGRVDQTIGVLAATSPSQQDQVMRVVPTPGSVVVAVVGLALLRIRRTR